MKESSFMKNESIIKGAKTDRIKIQIRSATIGSAAFAILLSIFQLAAAQIVPNNLSEVQFQNSSLVGTWRSGNFAYTFFRDGTYVYVGAIVTPGMQTKTAEKGTYAVNGDKLIIQRQSGIIATSMNYSQDLEPETRVYPWRLGYTQIGRTLQLIFPDGRPQNFYLSE